MLEIKLDNRTSIPLRGKSLLILPPGSRSRNVVNNGRDNYDAIMIVAGVDRTVNIHLDRTAILIIETGGRTTVNVTGTTALNTSQVVFIAEVDNKVNGLLTQNRGKIISARREEFDLASITDFERI